MAQYTYKTLAQAETDISLLLADPAFVRFLAPEIDLYIAEALRTWNALTGMFVDQGVSAAAIPASTPFIDLPTLFPTFRAYTLTDRALVGLMQYHLLEPYSPAVWTGTEQFTLSDLVSALQHARDQFLLDTGCRVSRHAPFPDAPAVIAPLTAQLPIDEEVIALVRAGWTPIGGSSTVTSRMWPSSNQALRSASPTWNLEPGTPRVYNFNQIAPHVMELAPPPADSGTLDLISVVSGAELDPTSGSGVLLGIPDDYAPFVKWLALSILLAKDGPGRDYARSLYCARRYEIGLAAHSAASVLIDLRVNDRPARFSTIDGMDAGSPNWQNSPGSGPAVIAPLSMNLCAMAPPPLTDIFISATMVRNAAVPSAPGDYLQIGREYLNLLYGYTAHLAMFKIGGQEFAATTHLADAFFAAAAERNKRLGDFSAFAAAAPDVSVAPSTDPRGIQRRTGSSVGGEPQGGA